MNIRTFLPMEFGRLEMNSQNLKEEYKVGEVYINRTGRGSGGGSNPRLKVTQMWSVFLCVTFGSLSD